MADVMNVAAEASLSIVKTHHQSLSKHRRSIAASQSVICCPQTLVLSWPHRERGSFVAGLMCPVLALPGVKYRASDMTNPLSHHGKPSRPVHGRHKSKTVRNLKSCAIRQRHIMQL